MHCAIGRYDAIFDSGQLAGPLQRFRLQTHISLLVFRQLLYYDLIIPSEVLDDGFFTVVSLVDTFLCFDSRMKSEYIKIFIPRFLCVQLLLFSCCNLILDANKQA